MPVSPVVQQHQQSIVQQSTTPEQLTYNKEFGEAAYELLSSKFPRLAAYTITFKILEGGEEGKDYGVGSFIIARGDDIGYIPVVLQGGSIVSCEMIYNKEEDSFKSLGAKEIKAIIAENRTQEHTIIKSPRTEDTKQIFTNMFRPPTSSNPVLASTRISLDILPDEAKETLSNHLKENPKVLAKIASFYDTHVLASRLMPAVQDKIASEKEVEDYAYMDKVIKLDELTEKTAEAVYNEYPEVVEDLIDKGYAIIDVFSESVNEVPPLAIPTDQFSSEIETSFNAQELSDTSGGQCGTANILKVTDNGYLKQIRCLVAGNQVLHPEFSSQLSSDNPVVVTNFKEGLSRDDIYSVFGRTEAYSPCELVGKVDRLKNSDRYAIFIPVKNDSFKLIGSIIHANDVLNQVNTLSKGIVVSVMDYGRKKITFTSDLKKGSIFSGVGQSDIYPLGSILVRVSGNNKIYIDCVRTLSELRKILEQSSIKLQYHQDGPDYNLTNRTLDKTAQFKSEADMVRYAVAEYHMDKIAADTLLEHKRIHLVKTSGAIDQAQNMAGIHSGQAIPMGSSEQPSQNVWNNSPGFEQREEPLVVDESLLEEVAEMGDEDLMDTGMIASLAGNDDIKSLLVDFVEDFNGTVTELAKAILIMVVNETEFKEQYGREDYAGLLARLRSVFTGLSGIVFDLNEYINNQSYAEGL